MKNILFLLFLLPFLALGQSDGENYIMNTTYKVPTMNGTTALDGSGSVTDAKKTVTIIYYDGLGRPKQQIAHRQSGTGTDMITHIEYDGYGRQIKEYLPYVDSSPSMDYIQNAQDATENYYNTAAYGNTANPYSEKLPEASPLNRVQQQAAPGNPWSLAARHTIKMDYRTNTATEVKLFSASATRDVTLGVYAIALAENGSTNYAAGQLYKTITYDENTVATPIETDGSTVEFKDKDEKVVLKRTYEASVKHDTYYVYDQYGNLTYVIPPLAADNTITSDILNNLCYQYRYDYRSRMVEKKLPGKQWEYIVYDKLDRIVATGPVFTPFGGTAEGWLITRYDGLDRPALTGWYPAIGINSTLRKALQNSYDGTVINMVRGSSTIDGIAAGYIAPGLPAGFKLLTLSYYDNYAFLDASLPLPATSPELDYINSMGSITAKGLQTGSWVRVLTSPSAVEGETSYILYDKKLRPVRNYTKNHLGGYTYTDSKLSFTGQILYSTTHHRLKGTGTELAVREDFTYDDQERILKHTHNINSGSTELLAANKYTELGQLAYKWVGGTDLSGGSGLQKMDYSYSIRGWLTGINNVSALSVPNEPADLFAFKINYDKTENCLNYTGTPLYNGNIAETYWRSSSDNILRKYGYKYDNLSRLRQAVYQKPDLVAPVTNSYNEALNYDKNGNITALSRNGYYDSNNGEVYNIDKLSYYYQSGSNRLIRVSDESNSLDGFRDVANTEDYKYDANGNLVKDNNKGMDITYNHLNLPTQIGFDKGRITYIYNAAGEKVSKTVESKIDGTTTVTQYQDGFQYIKEQLQFFPTSEGYVNVVKDKYSYIYNYTDHMGNVRLSFLADPKTGKPAIMEENNYYPFGLKQENYNSEKYKLTKSEDGVSIVLEPTERNIYQYKYNGKEYQDELGLNFYDYGARNYDPAIGRWMNIDPLTEEGRRWSPYVYAMDNPVYFIDPDGMKATDFGFAYFDAQGTRREYVFNGKDNSTAPTKFIQDFQTAYFYNTRNGGGESLKAIAENKNIMVYVSESQTTTQYDSYSNTIEWKPNAGLETDNGTILSPATVLEHEGAHALVFNKDPDKAKELAKTEDKNYEFAIERTAIKGPEQRTARANGEIPSMFTKSTRNNHNGQPVIVPSPTSTKVNRAQTYKFLEKLYYENYNFTGMDFRKYKN